MGRPRENRRVVTYSLGDKTIDRIEVLRLKKKQKYKQVRKTRVTLSEIIDDAIREMSSRVMGSTDDATHGGRHKPEWSDTEKWLCPYCWDEGDQPVTEPNMVGGCLVCLYFKCRKPRPEATYPEGSTLTPQEKLNLESWITKNPPEVEE